MLARLAALVLIALALAGCSQPPGWHARYIAGALPDLEFSMVRATDGKAVTADDYRGKAVLLYFGYTNCPDVCPATLANLAAMLGKLGAQAARVRVLFVSVDPDRDTLSALKEYTAAFAPEIDGLRGTADDVARLARRYRVAYTVRKPDATHPYEVNHSAAVFIFDPAGAARLVTLTTNDTSGLAADVKRLLAGGS